MPVAASKRQWRMMQAIIHGKGGPGASHPRGRPPASIAAKYTAPGDNAPESKDNDRGGTWTEDHHKAHKKGVSVHEYRKHHKKDDDEKKKHEKHLKKSFEDLFKGKGDKFAATLVMDNENRVLLGTHKTGGLAFPGGTVEPNESYEQAALREMHEETGAVGRLAEKIWEGNDGINHGQIFLAEIAGGKPKNTDEVKTWKWYEIDEIPWSKMRSCCVRPLKEFVQQKLGKSIRGMVALEALEKSGKEKEKKIDISEKQALKLVGNGLHRHLEEEVKGMGDESFKEIDFDTYKISIRKHTDGTYSGRVSDGHKVVFQWVNKSLHEVTASLMSLFEWYLPEDADVLDWVSDKNLSDDAIHGGLHHLVENYKRHNLGEIYQEMETIRENIRNGVAVDLQQVESKILKLFDKLEEVTHTISEKHNKLAEAVGKDLDELEEKLRELQSKIGEVPKKSKDVEAISSNPADSSKVHSKLYSYLSKPRVEIHPTGKLTISFGDDWEDMEKSNFLEDLRAKVIIKKR